MAKCADCGFLALRHEFTGNLDEADADYRSSGRERWFKTRSYATFGDEEYRHHNTPICFARAYDLEGELTPKTSYIEGEPRYPLVEVLAILNSARNCDSFIFWQQGFTPKEHREMLDRQWMVEQQERREEADRVWRDDQRAKDEQWRSSERDRDNRWRRSELRLIVAGIITAAVIGLVAAFISHNSVDVHVTYPPSTPTAQAQVTP